MDTTTGLTIECLGPNLLKLFQVQRHASGVSLLTGGSVSSFGSLLKHGSSSLSISLNSKILYV